MEKNTFNQDSCFCLNQGNFYCTQCIFPKSRWVWKINISTNLNDRYSNPANKPGSSVLLRKANRKKEEKLL